MDQNAIKRFHLKITTLSSAGSFFDGYVISIVSVAILLLAREFSWYSPEPPLCAITVTSPSRM